MLTFTRITGIFKLGIPVLLFYFPNYWSGEPSSPKKNHRPFTVGILGYKGFDPGLIDYVAAETKQFYRCSVVLMKPRELPAFAYYVPRKRYKADSLLVFEKALVNEDTDAIAGLTDKDISTSKDGIPDWGVFGLGLCPGQACVISTFRIRRASASVTPLKERLIKVVLHEIGHNLGLPHCTHDPFCLMTDAGGTIRQVDRENKWLCESCRNRLNR